MAGGAHSTDRGSGGSCSPCRRQVRAACVLRHQHQRGWTYQIGSSCQRASCRAPGRASNIIYDVFISHAGPQKQTIAASLQAELHRRGVSTFLDETSLRPGDDADAEMEAALRSCSFVVFVLTPDFLRSSYCMEELHWALHPTESHPPLHESASKQAAAGSAAHQPARLQRVTVQRSKELVLLPVFYHTSNIPGLQQQMQRLIDEAKSSGAPLADLQQAGIDLAALCRITGIREDSQGK
jgi:TIR domain